MARRKNTISDFIGTVFLFLMIFIFEAIQRVYKFIKELWQKSTITDFVVILGVIFLIISAKLITDRRRIKKQIRYQEFLKEQERLEKQEALEKRNILIKQHLPTLIKKYKQLTYMDDYGIFQQNAFIKELDYFIKNVLFKGADFTQEDYNYEYNRLMLIIENEIESKPQIKLSDNPYDFEIQCAEILKNNGWQAKTTQKSADQGIDVIATKDGVTVALQCKLYSRPVGNKAVQEAFSGKEFYQADIAGVVSNNTYTISAKRLAKNCGVLLLSPDDLPHLDSLL